MIVVFIFILQHVSVKIIHVCNEIILHMLIFDSLRLNFWVHLFNMFLERRQKFERLSTIFTFMAICLFIVNGCYVTFEVR